MTREASNIQGAGQQVPALVLSVFPGIDLFGRGFEAAGFCVVRGPDILWGGDIREFHPPRGVFKGIIGGPPCQDFSGARRSEPTGEGLEMITEFCRVVFESRPEWFLMENVPTVPDLLIPGYRVQRFNVSPREFGFLQSRNRSFQFGSLSGKPLVIQRPSRGAADLEPCCVASEGKKPRRRTFERFCALQGLPEGFSLPGMTRAAKYRAVGNGVHVGIATFIAGAIARIDAAPWQRLCVCGCGRVVRSGQTMATAACRKRMERRRRRDSSRHGNGKTVTEGIENVTGRPRDNASGSHQNVTDQAAGKATQSHLFFPPVNMPEPS